MAAPGADAKKKTLRASEQDRPDVAAERATFREMMPGLAVGDLVFVDECGVNRAMTPRYGRSRRGARCFGEAPRNYGRNVTLVGALTLRGVEACLQVESATTADIFTVFVEQILINSPSAIHGVFNLRLGNNPDSELQETLHPWVASGAGAFLDACLKYFLGFSLSSSKRCAARWGSVLRLGFPGMTMGGGETP